MQVYVNDSTNIKNYQTKLEIYFNQSNIITEIYLLILIKILKNI